MEPGEALAARGWFLAWHGSGLGRCAGDQLAAAERPDAEGEDDQAEHLDGQCGGRGAEVLAEQEGAEQDRGNRQRCRTAWLHAPKP